MFARSVYQPYGYSLTRHHDSSLLSKLLRNQIVLLNVCSSQLARIFNNQLAVSILGYSVNMRVLLLKQIFKVLLNDNLYAICLSTLQVMTAQEGKLGARVIVLTTLPTLRSVFLK